MAAIAFVLALPVHSHAQTAISPGENAQGTVLARQTNAWSFTAAAGDRVILQIGKISGGAGFTPKLELFAPDGARVASKSGLVAARLDVQTSAAGTYLAVVSDANQSGTGNYRIQLAKLPGTFTVSAGDEGGALANGANQPGTIDVGDLDAWTFPALPGDRIVVQIAKTSGGAGFSPLLELFAPDGARLVTSSGSVVARVEVQAVGSGSYTVVVSDVNVTGTGGYELHLAQVPESFTVPANDEGGPVPDALPKEGVIAVGDLDLWTFTTTPGSLINLQLAKLSGGAGFTPRVEVFAPDGQRKAIKQDAAAPALEFATEFGGTYTVLISDGNGTGSGSYRFTIGQSAIVSAPGKELVNGMTSVGNISPVGTDERWSFVASAGENIVVRVGEGVANSRLIPQVRLFGPGGALLDSAVGQVAAEIAVQATNSGSFSVSVRDSNAGPNTGTYRVTLAKTGSPLSVAANDEGGSLINGTNYFGSIETGDMDVWSFIANAGDNVVLRMGELTASLSPQLRLYDPSGALIDTSSGAAAAEVAVRATNSGAFLVIVGDLTSGYIGTGNYRLSMTKTGSPLAIAPSDEGGAVTNALSYTGSLEVGDIDAWSLSANVGDTIVARMGELNQSTLTPDLRLYDPSGALIDTSSRSAVAAEVTARATNSGTFLLIAGDFSSGWAGSGNYRLTMAKTGSPISISANDEGGFLTNGVSYLGSVETGDIDAWIINANAGDAIVARMGEVSANSALTPELRLYDPSGALLSSAVAAAAAEVSTRATNSGAFLLVAAERSSGWTGTGNYRLGIAKTGSPVVFSASDDGGPLANGTQTLGVIEVGDIDAWSFNANAGENIAVRMGEAGAGTLSPQLRLYDPSGALLDSFSGATAAEVAVRATNSGAFLVIASDLTSGWTGSGNYRVTLAKTGSAVAPAAGQVGGRMTGAEVYEGALAVGGLDVFSFTACAGETIALSLKEMVAGSTLTPWLRLWGRDGVELKSLVNPGTVEFTMIAPATGSYTVLVGDLTSGFAGSGTYRLTATGLTDTLRICLPRFNTLGFVAPIVVGGLPAGAFTLLSTTNIVTPVNQWTALLNGQFDQFGVFTITNAPVRGQPPQFFQIRTP